MKVRVKVAQLCPTLCDPMDYMVHGILQTRILKWVAFPFSRGSSQPRSSTLHMDSLTAEPPGKPKNTGVDSLSLLQWIFLTQESNQGLLHCRRILDQLSYEGSPKRLINNCNTNLPMDWYVALQFHYRFLLFAIPLLQKYSLTWTVLIKWKLYIKLQRNITSNFGKEVEKN